MKIYADGQINTNAEAHATKISVKRMRLNVRYNSEIADSLETAADEHLKLKEVPERGIGGELVSVETPYASVAELTLKKPDRVTVDASSDRLDLVHKNGVLNMALDTAEAINSKNPAEQMLAHQMATAHRMSLDLMAEAGNTRDPVEKCRLINMAAKLMETYQKAMLTIHRLHTGGQQVVTVQHVQVSGGGQAVINGAIHPGGPLSGREEGVKK